MKTEREKTFWVLLNKVEKSARIHLRAFMDGDAEKVASAFARLERDKNNLGRFVFDHENVCPTCGGHLVLMKGKTSKKYKCCTSCGLTKKE